VGLVRDVDAEGFIELVSYATHAPAALATAEQAGDVDAGEDGDDEPADD